MSLIDPLEIYYSSARGTKTFSGSQAITIKGFKTLLTGVGWSLTEEIKATGSVNYGIGLPVSDGITANPKRDVGCPATPFLTVGGSRFSLYDPYHENPKASVDCILVPIDTTPFGTISSLAGFVSSGSDFAAAVTQLSQTSFVLNLIAHQGGPDGNFQTIAGDGRWGQIGSSGGNTGGGGYELQSKSDVLSTQYKLRLTGSPSVFGNIQTEFVIEGGSAFYNLVDNGTYKLIANGYGFFLSNTNGEGSFPFVNYSMFAMAPVRPKKENFEAGTSGVLILGPRTFQNQTYYYGASGYISTAVDGPPATYSNVGGWPRVLSYRNAGPALISIDGKAVFFCAYATFGAGPSSSADIIGKLPDCAIVTEQLEPYGETVIKGQLFTVVSTQDGSGGNSASSLLMFSPLPVGDSPTPPPIVPDPIYPQTQPSSKSGTCTVPSVGFVVLGLTGDFTGLAHLSPITIAGAPYQIDAVQSAKSLTLTDIITAHTTPVDWTVP